MTALYSDLERTGNVLQCSASTISFTTSEVITSTQTSQQQSASSASAAVAVAVAAAELRQHHHQQQQQQQQQQQSVVSSTQTIINGNSLSSSVSSTSPSSSNISPISSSPQSNPNSSIGTPSLTGSPTSSTHLVGLTNCTSSSSGISSLSGISLNGGNRPNLGSNTALIEDSRTLQLALELSMVGLSDSMQAAAVAAALTNGHGHTQRQHQQQQQQNQHLNHHQQQQQLQSQQLHSQYELTCGLANAATPGIMQPTNVLAPGTTLNQFAASILPTLEDRSKKSQNMTECVPVPSSEHVAEIVGRQGCKIKALRAKTNTYIKTPVRGEEPVFVVTGRKEDVAKAKREILSAAEHFSLIRASRKPVLAGNLGKVPPGPPSIPGQVTIQVRVPYRVVGLVVGPKGATIKHIQQETHTYIVTPSREKEPIFEVTGLPDNVQAARKQIEAHIALRTGNLSPSVQTINSLSQMFIGDELNPEFLASIYKNGICSTFDYVDAQVSPADGLGCNMVVQTQSMHTSASNIGSFNGNANHHHQQQQQPQHLRQGGNTVVSASNSVMNSISGAMMGANNANNGIGGNSCNGNGVVGEMNGTSNGGSRSCSSSSSSTSSKSANNSRPELINIWKNLGESLDVDEGLGESPNIWTLPSVTVPIGCSPPQSVSPTDSLLGGAGGSTGSNNISHMISSTSTANIVNKGNRAGIASSTSQQLNNMRRECLVCGDKEVTAALVPCGHNMFCMECANHICTSVDGCCPVCSQTVYHAMRILP
ncbi:RNA-binding protein MEX3B [Eupeodes corollae]|uniref:RNA-binding protein MEX3B n=1 Tax=Eupeodes corollae TaxID=290404 RepID=UPI0024906CE2|nr:RNA-binding protein MEX3B [Eupeodes corollae]XP_055922229.1 RNA-binding protein MEX3B [Eupeodes corollae]XP_055922230.1 RNA-binding protein MEX3B [Eupeodes corollae]